MSLTEELDDEPSLYRATYGSICCGFEVDRGGIVRDAAPVLRWANGKPLFVVERWVRGNGGTVERLGC